MAALLTGVIVIVLVLTMTHEGHVIDAATQHFMLYYAGVFALIGLTASVGVGLVATDRIIMTPGHRVMAQAIHRAVSFGALAFLIIHILTEILAQRVHVIDSVVPFLSPFRTFYIGLGTIASDLIVLLVITSIVRKRFTGHGKAWQWRAIHYSAYASFVFGILHGLLGGRSGKPYVDWSYGACIALVAAGLTVRFLALSLRPKETLSAPPAGGKDGGTSPMQAAATLAMAQAQFGGTVQALPASGTGSWTATALPAAPYGATPYGATAALQLPAGSGYGDGGYAPLGAPPYGDDMPAYAPAPDGYPYQPALASLPGSTGDGRQPLYEPGYVGPPRFQGAPRPDAAPDAWYAPGSGPMPRALPAPVAGPPPQYNSGPLPQYNSGPMPRYDGGPPPGYNTGYNSGPVPRAATGPMPRATGPMPAMNPGAGQGMGSGPVPRHATGPMPAMTGPVPGAGPGPVPGSGPVPGPGTGPMPRAGSGPMHRLDPGAPGAPGPMPRQPRPGRRRRPPGDSPDDDRSRRGGGAWR